MKFPNAYAGVKKIFSAEILEIIGVVCLLFAGFFALTTVGAAVEGAETGALASLGAAAIFGLGATVLMIIAFIINIIGINTASKDEPIFKTAMTFVVIGIIASVVSALISNDLVKNLAGDLSSVSNILVTYYVITGIISLANKLGNSEVASKGKTVIRLIFTVFVLYIIAEILVQFVATGNVAAILAIVAAIIEFVQYIIYLVFLSKAKNMLAAAAE